MVYFTNGTDFIIHIFFPSKVKKGLEQRRCISKVQEINMWEGILRVRKCKVLSNPLPPLLIHG